MDKNSKHLPLTPTSHFYAVYSHTAMLEPGQAQKPLSNDATCSAHYMFSVMHKVN